MKRLFLVLAASIVSASLSAAVVWFTLTNSLAWDPVTLDANGVSEPGPVTYEIASTAPGVDLNTTPTAPLIGSAKVATAKAGISLIGASKDGLYRFHGRAIDAAGNKSPWAVLDAGVDTVPPKPITNFRLEVTVGGGTTP